MSTKLKLNEHTIRTLMGMFLDRSFLKELSIEERVRMEHFPTWAIHFILDRVEVPQDLIDSITKSFLARYIKSGPGRLFSDHEALRDAVNMLDHGVSKNIVELVAKETAKAGWNRTKDIVQIHLGRTLNQDEVRAMIESYLTDKATRSSDREQELVQLARKHLSPQEAHQTEQRMHAFREEFNNSCD